MNIYTVFVLCIFICLLDPEEEVFKVKLRQSSSLLFHGQCILEVHRDFERNLFHLALFSEDSNRRSIVKWQIDHIRQYGSNEMAFKFQSGRYYHSNKIHTCILYMYMYMCM